MSEPVPQHAARPARWRPLFAAPNLAALGAGIAVFVAVVLLWDTHVGVAVAVLAGGLAAGGAWWVATRSSRRDPEEILGAPNLGEIPAFSGETTGPAPVLTAPDSAAAAAYHNAMVELEAVTTGQVLLVSCPVPGQGATTAAINLAIAASRAGRRVLLVDGDTATRGLSRYSGSGVTPGLTDLAAGEAGLQDVARLWRLGDHSRMPVIPAGAKRPDEETVLRGPALADAVAKVTERADLVIIDSSPFLWQGAPDPLAVHADGTLLLLSPDIDAKTLTRTRRKAEESGAPVLGYIVNRAKGPSKRTGRIGFLKRAAVTALLLIVGYTVFTGYRLWDSWNSVERQELDTAGARLALPPIPAAAPEIEEITPEAAAAVKAATPVSDERFRAYLIVGSDLGGDRADVIILVLIPGNGGDPAMLSLPRDLYLPNRCTQAYSRINANLIGCGDEVNGPTLLALTVEDYTGIEIDHFALFDFDGFERIIDTLGGIEICLDYPVRDWRAELNLPAGCNEASGAQALAWVRSRTTEQLVGGRWRIMPGVSDLTRNERQQEVVLAMFSKIRRFDSAGDLMRTVQGLSDAFTLDDGLGLRDAINLAWGMRGLDASRVNQVQIEVVDHTTRAGAQVLLPNEPFDEILGALYPQQAIG